MHYSSDDLVVVKFSRNPTPKKDERPSEKIRNKNKTKKGPKSFWLRHVVEFFRTTGLHGYKYIIMEDTPFIERFMWAIFVSICLISAVTLVWIAWDFSSGSATLIVIESTHYQTWNYPFPAVTICSLNKVTRSKAIDLAEKLKLPNKYNLSSEDVFDLLKYVPVLLGNILATKEMKDDMIVLQDILNYNNITVPKLLNKVTPSCRDLMVKCWWKSNMYRCDTIFQNVNTSEGLCCAFNYHGARISSYAVKENLVEFKNPRRVAGCGDESALTVLVKINVNEYYSSTFGTYGIRIYIHDPYNYADDSSTPKLIGPSVQAFMEIDSETTYATDSIKTMDLEKRRCVVFSELSSKYFSKYTYTNCLAECRSKIVFNMCGCVPIFLPARKKDRICDFLDAPCVYRYRSQYSSSLPQNNVTCDCLPNCELQSYQEEISTGTLKKTALVNADDEFNNYELTNDSLVHVYFNDLMGTRYRMDIFSTWYGLLSSFGGLLSLFIGFSIVSGFELVYFFTVRFFFDMLHKDRIMTEPKDESEKDKKNMSNSQLFNRWVEKHQIVPMNEPGNAGRVGSKQKKRSDLNSVGKQRF